MQNARLTQLRIENIASVKPDDKSFPLRGINTFNIVLWLTRGNASLNLMGQTRGINPNTLIFIPTDTPYDLKLGQNTYGAFITAPLADTAILEPSILNIRHVTDQTQITSIVEAIRNEVLIADNFSEISQLRQFDLLMIAIQRMNQQHSQASKSTAAQKLMREFSILIEENVRQGHTVSWYAKQLNVTTAHLSRVCHSENHKPASLFLQNRIQSEACSLLKETDLAIAEIANRLGFSSPAYFTRFFSAKQKQTPREFRNQVRLEAKRSALARYG